MMADSIGFPREFNGSDWFTVIKDPTDALRVLFYNRLKASACFQRTLEHVVYLKGVMERVKKGVRANIGVFSFLSHLAVVQHYYIGFVWCVITIKYDENKNTPQQSHTCIRSSL